MPQSATATWKVIDNDHMEESEDAAPGRAYRNSEAECEAYIAQAAKYLPGPIVLCFIPHGPFPAVELPFSVIDRSAPTGEDRIVERFATKDEARAYVRDADDWGRLRVEQPHYGIVHETELEAALEAPSTRLIQGDYVKVGTPRNGERIHFPTLENYEESVVVRQIDTPVGAVEARVYPTGHMRITAGEKNFKRRGAPPLVIPGEGLRKGTIAFDAILEVKGNEAILAGVKRDVSTGRGDAFDDVEMASRGDRQMFAAVRAAAQVMAETYPNERLEALQRQYERTAKRAEAEVKDLEAKLRAAKGSVNLASRRYDEVTQALEAAREEAPSPAPGM